MREEIWNLFLKTGNIETYLLLKQLETNEPEEETDNELKPAEAIATIHNEI